MHFSAVLRSHVVRLSVRPSVRPFVRLSVTLVDYDHISWKSWKLAARTHSLFVAKRRSTYSQGNMGKFWGGAVGRKSACWRTKAAISLKCVNIEEKLLGTACRKLETHQRSFGRYHRPMAAFTSPNPSAVVVSLRIYVHTADATQLDSFVASASAVCIGHNAPCMMHRSKVTVSR